MLRSSAIPSVKIPKLRTFYSAIFPSKFLPKTQKWSVFIRTLHSYDTLHFLVLLVY